MPTGSMTLEEVKRARAEVEAVATDGPQPLPVEPLRDVQLMRVHHTIAAADVVLMLGPNVKNDALRNLAVELAQKLLSAAAITFSQNRHPGTGDVTFDAVVAVVRPGSELGRKALEAVETLAAAEGKR